MKIDCDDFAEYNQNKNDFISDKYSPKIKSLKCFLLNQEKIGTILK